MVIKMKKDYLFDFIENFRKYYSNITGQIFSIITSFCTYNGNTCGCLYMIIKAYANIWHVFFLLGELENGLYPHQCLGPVGEGMCVSAG